MEEILFWSIAPFLHYASYASRSHGISNKKMITRVTGFEKMLKSSEMAYEL